MWCKFNVIKDFFCRQINFWLVFLSTKMFCFSEVCKYSANSLFKNSGLFKTSRYFSLLVKSTFLETNVSCYPLGSTNLHRNLHIHLIRGWKDSPEIRLLYSWTQYPTTRAQETVLSRFLLIIFSLRQLLLSQQSTYRIVWRNPRFSLKNWLLVGLFTWNSELWLWNMLFWLKTKKHALKQKPFQEIILNCIFGFK